MSSKIPLVQTDDKDLNLFQTQLGKTMTPILETPLNYGVLLKDIVLSTGQNVVPTRLERVLQGWMIVRQRAQAQVWDTQDLNTTPNKTLLLNASTAVTVDLWVF